MKLMLDTFFSVKSHIDKRFYSLSASVSFEATATSFLALLCMKTVNRKKEPLWLSGSFCNSWTTVRSFGLCAKLCQAGGFSIILSRKIKESYQSSHLTLWQNTNRRISKWSAVPFVGVASLLFFFSVVFLCVWSCNMFCSSHLFFYSLCVFCSFVVTTPTITHSTVKCFNSDSPF